MCRFVAYKGEPILVDDLLFRPNHSLIKQSFEAQELEEPLNGDGFGLGWYSPALTTSPAVFVSMTPAWSNRNLKNLSGHITSGCIFAHVRAASVGDSSEANCHPFYFQDWMFMHNGGIEGFVFLKREVRRSLSDEVYSWVRGQTDSEHFFALVLQRLLDRLSFATPDDVMAAMSDAIKFIGALKEKHKITEVTYLNTCITNGKYVIASRYCSNPDEEPLSLYYSLGSRYVCEGGVCRIEQKPSGNRTAMIVSEPLTDLAQDWTKVPASHFVVIDAQNSIHLRPM